MSPALVAQEPVTGVAGNRYYTPFYTLKRRIGWTQRLFR